MDIITGKVSKIRDCINHPWKKALLLSNKNYWRMLCASMDVLEDTQQGINHYFCLPNFSANDGGYLFLYGLLQCLFVQQDAVSNLNRSLLGTEINWKINSDMHNIRELRNDAIGHPTGRRNQSFHFLTRVSIRKNSFDIMSLGAKSSGTKHIKLQDIKQLQESSIIGILDNILNYLKSELMEHKDKFKGQNLMSLIPATFGYYMEKVYEGINSDHPLASMHLDLIKKTHQSIKDGISERYGGSDVLESVKCITDKIDYVLDKMSAYFTNDEIFQNQDAEVFFDAFKGYFEELKGIISEIDEEFTT